MRFLFVKTDLNWPRTSGHDVHSYHMMKSLAEIGHEVALLTHNVPSEAALSGLQLVDQSVMPDIDKANSEIHLESIKSSRPAWKIRWNGKQERFRSYWGIEEQHIRFTRDHANSLKVDAVVVVGMEVLPYLAEIQIQQRIWYAADEWVWHHMSLVELSKPGTWSHVKSSFILGAYEYSFSNVIDRVWVVSPADQRAMRLVTGVAAIDVVANGVDANLFSPLNEPVEPYTCAFWGNLGFVPNEQALTWFCKKVWPLVLEDYPNAQFNIYGSKPSKEVLELEQGVGIRITAEVPEIRVAVGRQAVVVLPFQSGGGVKNKLLEAASLAKPILCSSRACNGLNINGALPFEVLPAKPRKWADALSKLWKDPQLCVDMGSAARQWVIANHSWNSTAEGASSEIRKTTTAASFVE